MKKIFIILGAIVADQITKFWVLSAALAGRGFASDVPLWARATDFNPLIGIVRHVNQFFNIVFALNTGMSFSFMQKIGAVMQYAIIIGIAALILFLTYILFKRAKNGLESVALSLIIGGATGNLIDRIRFGGVVDFLDFHVGFGRVLDFGILRTDGIIWPAFNVADSLIVVGIGLYVIYWWKNKRT